MANLTFREDRCKGCGLCTTVCPKKILRLSESRFNKEGYNVVECTDMSQCIACAMCATMCPDVVIRVEK
ncbi:MAG: 4Fe-4S dicluster domain-containing protein [Ruminococcaceae bacterium]|nr:4Fe-4S dicluster domain-containing protein [Oscillospiraceae bacterium]